MAFRRVYVTMTIRATSVSVQQLKMTVSSPDQMSNVRAMATVNVAFVCANFPMSGPVRFATSKTARITNASTVAPLRPVSSVPFTRKMARRASAPRILRLLKLKMEPSQTVSKIVALNFVLASEMLKENGASFITPIEREMIRSRSGLRKANTASWNTVC